MKKWGHSIINLIVGSKMIKNKGKPYSTEEPSEELLKQVGSMESGKSGDTIGDIKAMFDVTPNEFSTKEANEEANEEAKKSVEFKQSEESEEDKNMINAILESGVQLVTDENGEKRFAIEEKIGGLGKTEQEIIRQQVRRLETVLNSKEIQDDISEESGRLSPIGLTKTTSVVDKVIDSFTRGGVNGK